MWTDTRSRRSKHNCSALSLWAQRLIHHHHWPSYSCSATFHFCAFYPNTDSQHPVSQHASPCQPSPLLFPPGLGNTAEKWSRRKSQFDLRVNYSTAIRRLSSRLLLSIKIRALQRKLKRHSFYLQKKLCYIGLIYIASTAINKTVAKVMKRKDIQIEVVLLDRQKSCWTMREKYSTANYLTKRGCL